MAFTLANIDQRFSNSRHHFTKIDPYGDLLLEITLAHRNRDDEAVDEDMPKFFLLVSFDALRRSSSVFRTLLSQEQPYPDDGAEHIPVFALLEAYPAYFQDLCYLMHGRMPHVFVNPPLDAIARMAFMAHRYGCIEWLKPLGEEWMMPWRAVAAAEGGRELTLLVAYLLKNEVVFELVTRTLILHFIFEFGETFDIGVIGDAFLPRYVFNALTLKRNAVYRFAYDQFTKLMQAPEGWISSSPCSRIYSRNISWLFRELGIDIFLIGEDPIAIILAKLRPTDVHLQSVIWNHCNGKPGFYDQFPPCLDEECQIKLMPVEELRDKFDKMVYRIRDMAMTMPGLCLGCCAESDDENTASCGHLEGHGNDWVGFPIFDMEDA